MNDEKRNLKIQSGSIFSFVCGLLGILLSEFAFPLTLSGMIVGIVALARFDKEINRGKALAVWGLVLCTAYTILSIFKIVQQLY